MWAQELPHGHTFCAIVTAIDSVHDYWPNSMINRHWRVLDVDITKTEAASLPKQFGAITCISVLEHIEKYNQAIANMVSLLENDMVCFAFKRCASYIAAVGAD